MALLSVEEQEDKFLAKVEALCEEVDRLRRELSISQQRVAFLEERIEICYNIVFGATSTKPSHLISSSL